MQATIKSIPFSFQRSPKLYYLLPPLRLTSASPFCSSSSSSQWFSFLRDAISTSDLSLGKCTHARILAFEENPERFLVNNLISMYSKCGSLTYARLVFDKMPERDLVSWNSILAAYAQSSEGVIENVEEGFHLFRILRQDVVFTSRMTLAPLLKLCLHSGYVWASETVHGYACKIGLDSDEFVSGALVNIYLKFGKVKEGRVLFEEMPYRDVVLWNLMLKAYLDRGLKEEAVDLSSEFGRSGLHPNETTLRLLDRVSGDDSEGGQVKSSANGNDASVIRSKNQILTKYLKGSQYSALLQCFADMVESNLECDDVTFILVLATAVRLDSLALGQQVHCMALKLGFDLKLTVANSIINMYCKLRRVNFSRTVFNSMNERDLISWNSVISGFAQSGLEVEAVRLFMQLLRCGLTPDHYTMTSVLKATSSLSESLSLNKQVHVHAIKTNNAADSFVSTALIDAYSRNRCMKEAEILFERNSFDLVACNAMMSGYTQSNDGHKTLKLFALMHHQGERSDDFTLATVLKTCADALGRAGLVREAEKLIESMSLEASASMYRALLAACRVQGDTETGKRVATKLLELEPLDSSAYVLLSNMYAAASKWSEMKLARTMMKGQKVKKDPGFSWIEVKNKIHLFVVDDRSNPQSELIYKKVKDVIRDLKQEGYVPETDFTLVDVEEEEKERALYYHSEKLAVAFGLMSTPASTPIRVIKNLRVCGDCHNAMKYIAKVYDREIILRDANRFHRFKDGKCSCGDFW
ncbi:hypothetical protein F2Q70_00034027 [Brassica cretica]|uniref:DYW domain-containing protein n=1 Tax=Brassica cretica TaxID=69181 RepID=A0A8S9JRV5_BRACR|nr:hypothetical protein F2Q70_00034027 [Brassica cretica]